MAAVMNDTSVKVSKPVEKQPNNITDIEGSRPKNRHVAKPANGRSLNASDIEGAKANVKQYSYHRRDMRNPLEPIKEMRVAETNAPYVGGDPNKQVKYRQFDSQRLNNT